MTSHSVKEFDAATGVGATSKNAVAKLVKAWESKNGQRAVRGSGLGLMAVTLAACGGSDTTTTTPTTPTAPVVTPASLALTTGADILDANDFTSAADTVTATGETLNSGDIILDATTGDGDTLTVALTANLTATPTVAGIENIVFNVSSFAAVTIQADGIANGSITVNNVQVGGATAVTVEDAGAVTVKAGSGVSSLTVIEAADASATVVDAGAATSVKIVGNAATSDLNVTVNGDVTLELGTADSVAINATAASTVTYADAASALATVSVTGAAVTISADTGSTLAVFDGDTVTGAAAVSGKMGAADLTKVAGTVIIADDGGADANAVLTIAGGAVISTLDANEVIQIAAKDDASATTDNLISATVSLDVVGAKGVTLVDGAADDSEDTVNVLNVVANKATTDFTVKTAAGVATTLNLSGSAAVTLKHVAGGTEKLTVDASAMTGALTAAADKDKLLSITGGSGADKITAAASGAMVLAGGAGNDTLLTGGATDFKAATISGFEILNAAAGAADFLASQLNGATYVVLKGSAIEINDASSIDVASINLSSLVFEDATDTVKVDLSKIDATKLLANQTFTFTGSSAADTVVGSDNADNISGGAGADVLGGGKGADVINGGAGDDKITGGVGVDALTGGAGADDFIFASGDTGITVATADVISDFSTADNDELDVAFDSDGGANPDSVVTIADGTSVKDFTALVALVDAAFTSTTAGAKAGNGDVYVSYNALGTGDAYVFVDEDDNGSFNAGDTFFILTGVNLSTEIVAGDFI